MWHVAHKNAKQRRVRQYLIAMLAVQYQHEKMTLVLQQYKGDTY